MSQVHFYLAATVCILVQLVACGQRCGNAGNRPLSFTVVNKRNATCHWMPEVQMDPGADDPLLNGGWQVRITLPKASTRGYGQVVEVMATKKFNEFTAPTNELCGAATTSSILSLINANQKTVENSGQTTTPVPFAVTPGIGTTQRMDDIQPLPTEATTTKKMEILFVPSTSTSKPSSVTAKTSATPQNLITPASSNTNITSKMTMPMSVPTTTLKDSTSKMTTKTFTSSGDPALASSSTTTVFLSTENEKILLPKPSVISKSSTSITPGASETSTPKITKAYTPATEMPSSKKLDILLTTQSTISKSSPTHTTVSSKSTTASPTTIAATTTALTSTTEAQTTKKTDNIFTTPTSISKSSPSTTAGTSKTSSAARTTASTKVPTSKNPDIFIDLPKVSTPTKAPSTKAATQPKTATDHTNGWAITNTDSTPRITLETLFTHPVGPTTHTLSTFTSTTKPSIPVEEVSPPTKDKGASTGKPTSSIQPEIDGNDGDKIDDSDLGEKGDEYHETIDLDVDVRGREDDDDKKDDYVFDYSLNLDVEPE